MRFTLVADDGVVVVDGVARKVDLSGLPSDIHAVQFDSVLGEGEIEYKRSARRSIMVRDLEAEEAEEREAKKKNRKYEGGIKQKAVLVPKENERITSLGQFQAFLDRWSYS